MAGLVRTVEPTLEPVSLQEQKDHARIVGSQEDSIIASYITAARVRCENKQGQAYVTQTWRKQLDRFPHATRHNPHRSIYLDRPPLQYVTSVTYLDQQGTSTVMPSSDYLVNTDDKPGSICPKYNGLWPTTQFVPGAISIVYQAGYGGTGASVAATTSAAQVPETTKLAIKTLAQYYYQNRDTDGVLPQAVEDLLASSDFGIYRIPTPEDFY